MIRSRRFLLYAALAIIGVLYVGDMALRRLIDEPLEKAETIQTALQQEILHHQQALAKAEKTLTLLPDFEQRSLPRDLDLAKSKYQAWLLRLVTDTGLKNPMVDPKEAINQGNLFHVLKFDVRGRGSLDQTTNFLYRFYQAGHLHQIRTLTLNPLPSSHEVDLSLSIDAISLPTATQTDELTDLASNRLASSDLNSYQPIVRRDLFGVGGRDEFASQTLLTAITSNVDGTWEAWFTDPRQKTRILRAGDVLAASSYSARLTLVTSDKIVLEVDGQRRVLVIGKSLSEASEAVTEIAELSATLVE